MSAATIVAYAREAADAAWDAYVAAVKVVAYATAEVDDATCPYGCRGTHYFDGCPVHGIAR